MNNRLKQFLAAENISQAQFADTIKVVRASVSHVLAGRNNPSYDFLKAIMDSYPSLNIEWLMQGKGKMYKESVPAKQEVPESGLLFDDFTEDTIDFSENIKATTEIKTIDSTPQVTAKQRSISKIIILYDDGSFQEL